MRILLPTYYSKPILFFPDIGMAEQNTICKECLNVKEILFDCQGGEENYLKNRSQPDKSYSPTRISTGHPFFSATEPISSIVCARSGVKGPLIRGFSFKKEKIQANI